MKVKKQGTKAVATLDFSDSTRDATVADADRAMQRAAECAVRLGFDLNVFMQAAHSAYMQANPAAREHLEARRLLEHVEHLRRRGVLATA
jgi:sugar phosphate isomerase/epimerase